MTCAMSSCAWSKATIGAFARAKRPMPSCAENFLFAPQQPLEAVERHSRAAAHASPITKPPLMYESHGMPAGPARPSGRPPAGGAGVQRRGGQPVSSPSTMGRPPLARRKAASTSSADPWAKASALSSITTWWCAGTLSAAAAYCAAISPKPRQRLPPPTHSNGRAHTRIVRLRFSSRVRRQPLASSAEHAAKTCSAAELFIARRRRDRRRQARGDGRAVLAHALNGCKLT